MTTSFRSAVMVMAFLGSIVAAALPVAGAEPVPGAACRPAELGLPVPRIVPEPELATDYIGFDEWRTCLNLLNKTAPQFVEIYDIGKSPGWNQAGGGKLQSPILWVEITNEASPIPFEHKLKNLFVLSIHGNEMGGREGGMRVIEDLARGIGIAAEYPKLREYLDFQVEVFVFANPDGWVHEDLAVFGANPSTGYTRANGNGFDLNRQWPNHGWSQSTRKSMSQPEIINAVKRIESYTNWAYGSDIHGMATPTDVRTDEYGRAIEERRQPKPGGSMLMGMLSAGQSDPAKMLKTTRVATLLKERVDTDPNLREWGSAPNLGFWGGEVMHWGTSWDTIGYVDSGFTGDYIFQPHGMDAVDIDFELAYSVSDTHYLPAGMELNRIHVRAVRQLVAVFMDGAAADVSVSYDTKGTKTAYLYNPKVVSNLNPNGTSDPLDGWPAENPDDDLFDYAHIPYHASANDYLAHLPPFLRDGEKPGVLEPVQAATLDAPTLGRFDNLVVAGSAMEQLRGRDAAIAEIKSWTEGGGNLVLTDQSLSLLVDLGLAAADDIKPFNAYAGHTNFVDRTSPLTKDLRGLARQTYEAIPVGFQPSSAPNWYVEPAAWQAAGGKTIGVLDLAGGNRACFPVCLPTSPVQPARTGVNLGEAPLGEGTVRIIGSLLPDPTEEYFHPYGLDSYATTYTGNLLFRNLLGWDEVYADAPVVAENLGNAKPLPGNASPSAPTGDDDGASSPGAGALLLVMTFTAAAVAAGRWTRPRQKS